MLFGISSLFRPWPCAENVFTLKKNKTHEVAGHVLRQNELCIPGVALAWRPIPGAFSYNLALHFHGGSHQGGKNLRHCLWQIFTESACQPMRRVVRENRSLGVVPTSVWHLGLEFIWVALAKRYVVPRMYDLCAHPVALLILWLLLWLLLFLLLC